MHSEGIFVIPAPAFARVNSSGNPEFLLKKNVSWIPGQARNDKKRSLFTKLAPLPIRQEHGKYRQGYDLFIFYLKVLRRATR